MTKAIEIEQTQEHGYTVYRFDANATGYEVLTQDNVEFTVFSHRKSLSGRNPPKVYNTLAELAKRSKALANFAKLIAA